MLGDAMGFTANIWQRLALVVPTLQVGVSYLRPTPIARVVARGEVLRMGGATVPLGGAAVAGWDRACHRQQAGGAEATAPSGEAGRRQG
jgi:hypothetical protein